jgi:PAS domain S-box-containing protein
MDMLSTSATVPILRSEPGCKHRTASHTGPQSETAARYFSAAQTLLQRAETVDIAKALTQALALAGKALGADRAYIFQTRDTVFLDNTHEWCADKVPSMKPHLQNVPYTDGDPFWTVFQRTGIMVIPDLDQLAPDSGLRQVLDGQDIRALIAAAIWRDGQVVGFVGFDFVKSPRQFRPDEDMAVRNFAATVALALQTQILSRNLARVSAQRDIADARLSATISRTPKLLVESDATGTITGFFQSVPLVFALNPQEVIGAPPEQVLPPHVAAIVRKAMAEVDTLGWSQSFTYALDVGGLTKWFSLSAMARHPVDAGRKSGYMFVVTDISETQRQEAQIRQLVRVAELSTNLILLTDKDRRITWANPAFHARTGFPNAMVLGRRPSEVLQLDHDQPDAIDSVCNLLDRGHSISQEFRARSRRGVQYWLDLNIQPLRGPDGEIQGFMLVGVDITAHKMAEARALRDKVRTLDASKEGYAIFWPDGRVDFMNAELRRMLGLPDTPRTVPLIWTDLALPDFTDRLVSILPELMARGYWSDELSRTGSDGQERHTEISLTVQDDSSIFLILRDVTDRKRAQAERARLSAQLQIAQSRQVLSHMAAGMAHDFANLLAVITGSIEVLQTQITQSDRAALARIRLASDQGRHLVENLMKFGSESQQRVRIDLQDVAARAIDLLRPSLKSPVMDQLGLVRSNWIMADPTQVMQVLINLMMNADQAMQTHGPADRQAQIAVTVTQYLADNPLPQVHVGHLVAGQSYAVLSIADSGPGISEPCLAEIFAPFVSGNLPAGHGTANSGLGLAIVAHIVTEHQGALRVYVSEQGGADVQVFWPLHTAPLLIDRAPANPSLDTGRPLAGLNVLLVDDDDQVLQTMSTILSEAGAETASCDNPLDALSAIHDDLTAWDVVVTDHDMVPMTGLELAQDLLKSAPDLKIILISGASELQIATNSVHTMPVAMLRKPISGPELIAVLLREKLRDAGSQTKG